MELRLLLRQQPQVAVARTLRRREAGQRDDPAGERDEDRGPDERVEEGGQGAGAGHVWLWFGWEGSFFFREREIRIFLSVSGDRRSFSLCRSFYLPLSFSAFSALSKPPLRSPPRRGDREKARAQDRVCAHLGVFFLEGGGLVCVACSLSLNDSAAKKKKCCEQISKEKSEFFFFFRFRALFLGYFFPQGSSRAASPSPSPPKTTKNSLKH